MPGTKIGPKNAAQEFLIANARKTLLGNAVIPTFYTRLTPKRIYDFMLVNWADHKGNAAMVYGSMGTSVGGTVGFDFGMFICPGIANVSVNVGLQGRATDEAVLLIHRAMPDQLIKMESRLNLQKSFDNTIPKPVTFMVLNGIRTGASVTLTVNASIGLGSSFGMSQAPVSMGAFGLTLGGANVSGTLSGDFYTYYDHRPGFYKNSKEKTLLFDFTASLGSRHTHFLKREITAWLREVKKQYVDPKPASQYPNLKAQFKSLPSFNFPGFRASTVKVNTKLREILAALDVLEEAEKNLINDSLVLYKKELEDAAAAQSEYVSVDKVGREPDRSVVPGLCYLHLKNIKGELRFRASILNSPVDGAMGGGTGIGTSIADAATATPLQTAAATYTIPSITIGAGVEVLQKWVRTFYRYQTFAFGSRKNKENRIVYTQDVIANYSETDVTFAMQLGLDTLVGTDIDLSGVHVFDKSLEGLQKIKTALTKGKTWGKRSLRYRAVIAYWKHRNSVWRMAVPTLNGSGLAFGFSMRIQDLIRIAREENQANLDVVAMDKKVAPFAQLLRVSNAQFREFAKSLLVRAELEAGDRAVTGFENLESYGAVLVESSFRLTKEVMLPLKKKDGIVSQIQVEDLTEKAEWKDFFSGNATDPLAAGVELEAIRVRLRLEDHTSNNRSVFRLGLYLFGTGISFDLGKIEAAGNEGILDIHTHNFLLFDQDNTKFSENLRDGVPPVMLMPHHFNE